MKPVKIFILVVAFSTMIGCNQMNGTYNGTDQAHFDKIVFVSKYKVELIFLGSTVEAEYEKEGNHLKINTAMGKQVLNIDKDGCLDGGFIMGKYCKE